MTIVLHNSERELGRCLAAIRPDVLSGFAELIAVDNASPDDSARAVASVVPDARIIRPMRTWASRRAPTSRGLTCAVATGCF